MSETSLNRLYRKNFLEYASYVIKDRAIPDVADGLKPVQRRILWSLFQMDDGRFSKVANVIGHCMQYHPHGDRSIGDALVALANRGFFIERQGNFGNILTGDEASAARYIECRLTELARETLFNRRITDFVPSYDGRNQEPLLLPAKLPVVLLLGAEGIAVGMSTRLLPHNFQEVLRAQIACLRDQEFRLYPDFPQGGRIEVSDYEDGQGRVRNRARIEVDGSKNLVIREIPWGTTTESLIGSIELAAKKGKVRIASIDDYTTDAVEINIRLSRGVTVDEGIKRLYAHTDCEMAHTSKAVVIQDGVPVETTVTEVVHYCTGRLIEILRLELRLLIADCEEKLHWLTLEQIFIERRIYKEIEECESLEKVRSTVRKGMRPFLEEQDIRMTDDDLDRLLSLKIRRISRFDIETHRNEMGEIRQTMKEAHSNLDSIVDYAVAYLESLLDRYGRDHPRLTSVEDFSEIDVKEVAIRNLKAGFNCQTGLLGTSIKGDRTFAVSEYDRFVFFLEDGTYRVVPVQDKYFIDGKVLYIGVLDRERVFTAVYGQKCTGIAYIKRFRVDSFILDKEYRFFSDGGSLLFFTAEEDLKLEIWFQRKKRMRKRKDEALVSDFKVTSDSAKGVQLCGRTLVSSIRGIPLDTDDGSEPGEGEEEEGSSEGNEDGIEGALEESATGLDDEDAEEDGSEEEAGPCGEDDAAPDPGSISPEDLVRKAGELRERSSRTVRELERSEEDEEGWTGDLFRD
ncbi:MAG: hypothetical protein AVO35_03195 [Candidatus Aegiribacteria sp. MLS_C]|nr:MAG: hypothetical protein AVO35_03195 [Candidatus Aegiribacteria sp. MLS_C]